MNNNLIQTQKVAAIDIGSNAMRIVIAQAMHGKIKPLITHRESVRLGADVFRDGVLSQETLLKSVQAMSTFKSLIDKNDVNLVRAIGTSALREAKNAKEFVSLIKLKTNIDVEIIDGDEEARLVYLAVSETVGFSPDIDLLIDLGGGSAELTLCKAGDILYSESLKIGTVRLMNLFAAEASSPQHFVKLIKDYSDVLRTKIQKQLADQPVSRCIGTGGNLETFLAIRDKLFPDKQANYILRDELEDILDKLLELSVEERINQLGLREDRADVVVPAAIVILQVLKAANVNKLEVPGVGVREGVAYQLVLGDPENDPHFERKHLIQAALQLGKKYRFSENHAKNVALLAINIFEQTQAIHQLDEEAKKLLEIAALLHDIGHFVSSTAHHKHSYYLIQAASFPALTRKEKLMVACIARYHRKKFPEADHPGFSELHKIDQDRVLKLSAILRVADGLDRDQTQHVQNLRYQQDPLSTNAKLIIEGSGDLSLDSWSGRLKADLFWHVYGIKLEIVTA